MKSKNVMSIKDELKLYWMQIFLIDSPDEETWNRWFKYYPAPIIKQGLVQLSLRHKKDPSMCLDHMIRFTASIMGRLDRDRREALERLKEGAAPWHSSLNSTTGNAVHNTASSSILVDEDADAIGNRL
jgi:hypothetical protein